MLQHKVRIRELWAGFYDKLLNTKPLTPDPTITDLLPPRPLKVSLGDKPSMNEMVEALKGIPNREAVRPDGLPVELLKTDHPAFAQCFHHILVNVWVTGEVSQQWRDFTIQVLH